MDKLLFLQLETPLCKLDLLVKVTFTLIHFQLVKNLLEIIIEKIVKKMRIIHELGTIIFKCGKVGETA